MPREVGQSASVGRHVVQGEESGYDLNDTSEEQEPERVKVAPHMKWVVDTLRPLRVRSSRNMNKCRRNRGTLSA